MKPAPFSSSVSRVLPDLVVYNNTYRGFNFPRHFHESYLVELVEAGTEDFYCNGTYYNNVPKDTLILINPGEIHTGGDNSHRSEFGCKVFYPSTEDWYRIAGEKKMPAPRFNTTITTDPFLIRMMKQMTAAAASPENQLLVQELYLQLMTGLLQKHMKQKNEPVENIQVYERMLSRSVEFIHDHLSQRLLLEDIARSAFTSPFHFLRLFKKFTGMTLHQYILALRIDKAKKQLAHKECSIESVYNEVGFVDQSHFTKVFRKLTGLTPGQFREMTAC